MYIADRFMPTRGQIKNAALVDVPIGTPDTSVHYDPVTAGVVGAVGGGLISSSGAKSAAKTTAAASDRAAELAYQSALPWGVMGPGGYAGFDEETKQAVLGLSPELQALYGQQVGYAGGLGQMMAPYYQATADIGTGLMGQYSRSRGLTAGYDEFQRDLANAYFGRAGEAAAATQGYIGEQAGLGQTYLQRAAQQRGALAGYDPASQAASFYEQYVQPGIAKEQEREALKLENRLLAQGMLGSTGGALRSEALAAAQGDVRRRAQAEAFGQSQQFVDTMRQREMGDIAAYQAAQQNIFGREAADIVAGTGAMTDIYGRQATDLATAQGMFGQLGAGAQTALGNVTNLSNLPLQYANLGRGIGGGLATGGAAGANIMATGGANAALTRAAGQMGLGSSIANLDWSKLFSSGTGYTTQPTNTWQNEQGNWVNPSSYDGTNMYYT